MNEIIKFLIEFVLSFALIFVFYYFILMKQYKKKDENKVPTEVNIILRYHKIDIKRINYKWMLIWVAIISSFIISLTLTVVYRLIDSGILIAVVTVIVAIPIALTGYDIVGRYFEKKSNALKEEDNKKTKKKKTGDKHEV